MFATENKETVKFIARVTDKRGKTLYRTEPMTSREIAAAYAFTQRPKAKTCSTSRSVWRDGTWIETHMDIRWHNVRDF
jgi:hypothetical protein